MNLVCAGFELSPEELRSRVYGWSLFIPTTVEDLLRLPEDKYSPPVLSVPLPSFPDPGTDKFGHNFRKTHFLLDDVCYLNSGACGVSLIEAVRYTQEIQIYCETHPARFFERELYPILAHVTRLLAKFIGADPWDVALQPNATTGTCAIVWSLIANFNKGDSIACFNATYFSTIQLMEEASHIESYQINLNFPIRSKEEILETIKNALRPGTRLLIVDHISSYYAFVMPVKEVIDLCHSRGVLVLVDGAHALGSLPINMKELGADFYVTNCHKWLSSHKGCGIIYVAPKHQAIIRPMVIAHSYQQGFPSEFMCVGTTDNAPCVGLLAVLKFWEHYGRDSILHYMHTTAMAAADLMTKQWKTGLMADRSLFGPMVAVKLPPLAMFAGKGQLEDADTVALKMYFQKHNIEVAVRIHNGELFVRVSAHIHNEMKEYQHLADMVTEMAA